MRRRHFTASGNYDPNNPNSLTVREALANKHPKGQPPHPNCILPSPPQEVHPVVFDALDASSIRSAALHTSGSAGPSGLDAYQWRRLCTSFKRASDELCHQLAMVARRLCTSYVAPPPDCPFPGTTHCTREKPWGSPYWHRRH